ncbi:vacuolar membrane protein-domain-containing protein [Cunninghamella echinulata]|nr:vacuolar membrane protein-domain-containing protein [Cunninghamella echinulata]
MTSCQTTSKGSKNECQLLDGFALIVQFLLAFTALLLLLYKRHKEKPRRPFTVWCLDISKQFISAGLIHCINIEISYISSSDREDTNNMCVWYLLSVFWDTTFGLLLLYFWLHTLTLGLQKWGDIHIPLDYGDPPLLFNQLKRWAKQTCVFLMAELLMKICQLWCFRFAWIFYLGEWFLSWTRHNYHFQVVFVMFLYPLIMNGIQFWTIDTIIKYNRNNDHDYSTNQKLVYQHADPVNTYTTIHDHVIIHLPPKPNEHSPLLSS